MADTKASLAIRAANHSTTPLQRAKAPTIRWRLVMLATACMAIAAALAGAAHLSQAWRERAIVESEVRRAAYVAANHVEQELAVATAFLSGLAVSHALQTSDLAAFYREAKAAHTPLNSYIDLFARGYTSRTDEIVNTRRQFGEFAPPGVPIRPSLVDFIRKVVTSRQTQVSDLEWSIVDQDYTCGVGMPIFGADGDVRYVLVLVIPKAGLVPAYTGPGSAISGILDRAGNLVRAGNSGSPLERAPFDVKLMRGAGTEGALDGIGPDGAPIFVAFARSATTGWTIFNAVDRSVLDEPIDRALLIVGFGIVCVPLAGLGIALVLGPGVTRPFRRRIAEDDERSRVIANSVPSLLFTADRAGSSDYVSERFYAFTGMAHGTAEGHGWLGAIHPDDRSRALRGFSNKSGAWNRKDIELRIRSIEGSYRWFAVRTSEVTGATGKRGELIGTATDIDDLKRTENTLRQVSMQLMRSQDNERRRIAREIHDTTLQNLVAAKMQIDQARSNSNPRCKSRAIALDDAHDLLEQSLAELRTLSYLLHPPMLDELGIAAAVRWYARGFEKRSGIAVRVDAPTLSRYSTEVETTLFRVVQEGLANIHRHSGSHEARITFAPHPDRIELEISDSGRGFPSSFLEDGAASLGVGISGMRVRTQQLGGALEVITSGSGTTLRVTLPFTLTAARDA